MVIYMVCQAFSPGLEHTKMKRPRDTNQLAKRIIDLAVGEATDVDVEPVNEFARAGGLKGGKARARNLTPERRREIARKAAKARWEALD